MPKYPEVHVDVEKSGPSGNAFAVLGNVRKGLRKAGVPQAEIDTFMAEATAGNYEALLAVCEEWVDMFIV